MESWVFIGISTWHYHGRARVRLNPIFVRTRHRGAATVVIEILATNANEFSIGAAAYDITPAAR